MERLVHNSFHCTQILKAGGASHVVQKEAKEIALTETWMDVVYSSNVWISLSWSPLSGRLVEDVVLWDVHVKVPPCHGVLLIEFEKRRQCSVPGFSQLLLKAVACRVVRHPLSIRQMHLQFANWWEDGDGSDEVGDGVG